MTFRTIKSQSGETIRIYPSVNCYSNWKYNLFILAVICLPVIQIILGIRRGGLWGPLEWGMILLMQCGLFLASNCLFGCFGRKPDYFSLDMNACDYIEVDNNGDMRLSGDTESYNDTTELTSAGASEL